MRLDEFFAMIGYLAFKTGDMENKIKITDDNV